MAPPAPMKNTLKTFGTFSTPSFGGVGEPFQDGRQLDARTTGRQFITNKQRGGQIGDNWNRGQHGKRTDIKRLYEGEKYVEQHKVEAMFAAKEREGNLTTNGFRYSSPNKKPSGLGNYYGCIGPKHKHEPDFEVVKHGEKPGPVVHETKQIVTNPPKKGYGSSTPGCIFGPGPLKGEVGFGRYGGREYAHATDPYDASRLKEKADRVKEIEAIAGRPPYKTMGRALDFFDTQPKVASSQIFTENPRVPEKPPPPPELPPVSERPFYPSRAPRSGPQGTFEKFPKYIEDPLDLKVKAAKEAANALKREGLAPFKPNGNVYSVPTPTIVFHAVGPGSGAA